MRVRKRARAREQLIERVMRQNVFSAKKRTLRCGVHEREAGLLCLLDLAPVSVKLSDMKSWYQIFITTGSPTLCVMVLSSMFSRTARVCVRIYTQI